MRIISGQAKGRKLFSPAERSQEIRPTSDRAREALFSILGSKIGDSNVLDLFAGTGALGCEALSRGAQAVTFIELNKKALALIKQNVSLIPQSEGRSRIIKHDLRRSLPSHLTDTNSTSSFDLVFADPPYSRGITEKILHLLDNCSVLSEKVLVIVEEQKSVDLDIQLDNLILDNRRCYGDTCFSFFKRKIK